MWDLSLLKIRTTVLTENFAGKVQTLWRPISQRDATKNQSDAHPDDRILEKESVRMILPSTSMDRKVGAHGCHRKTHDDELASFRDLRLISSQRETKAHTQTS